MKGPLVTTQPRRVLHMLWGVCCSLGKIKSLFSAPSAVQTMPDVSWLVFSAEIISLSLARVQLGWSLAILLFPTLKRNSSEPSPAFTEMPDPKDQVQSACSQCLHFISRESLLQVSRQGVELA